MDSRAASGEIHAEMDARGLPSLRTLQIRFRHPRLPDFVDEVLIRALSIGGSRMDILLRKHEADVAVNVLHREGKGRVAITL